MIFGGAFDIPITREKMWSSFVEHPESMIPLLPDCQEFETISENEYKAKFKVGISSIKGAMNFQFFVIEKNSPSQIKLTGHGTGIRSVVDMESIINLEIIPDGGTKVLLNSDIKVSGLIASVGTRLIYTFTEKKINEFYKSIKEHVEKELDVIATTYNDRPTKEKGIFTKIKGKFK
ncbi:MAG: SRPBCC domain-containing protein [Thermodesulfobacteriota bacterium]|nr:SRPBCC domain-containing protein [Thermodesulfobacteriota bacterium]